MTSCRGLMIEFVIWRKFLFKNDWTPTAARIVARTDKEAQTKLRRRYRDSDFSSMSLVAVRPGQTPWTRP